MGASAGGVEALQELVKRLPTDAGLAVIVLLHMDPERKSLLPEILRRCTSLPMTAIEDGIRIEPDHIYVARPRTVVTVVDGVLRVRLPAGDGQREPLVIDTFMNSLAHDQGQRCAGVVLSGTGHDGSLGLKAVRSAGGLTVVQGSDGSSPSHEGMPASAIATGAVDLILPIEEMPERLHAYFARRRDADWVTAPTKPQVETRHRLEICAMLNAQTGHDFSHYKRPTFMRRVGRRMQVLGLTQLDDYVQARREDGDEVNLLLRDLLIGVTSFFRDPETFEALEREVVPRLFEGRGERDTVRLWVPGCATGEEAYSLAMLLSEHASGLAQAPRVQIFGTDIDDAAIGVARAGRYPHCCWSGSAPSDASGTSPASRASSWCASTSATSAPSRRTA
ncbi:chemotaxis protein CheB [Coralloluteibacterium stylophorae]|uniref:protein-glutamate O-methyltransferase n=1 Tax=Coralloluteibacterium stylophorae TaxID=1776034 RepID=A0A8J7VVY5_9GAMM|nr:hypothetical protein [Coralloluteibacterium stylophorae]